MQAGQPLLRAHLVRQATILFLVLLHPLAAVLVQASIMAARQAAAVQAAVQADRLSQFIRAGRRRRRVKVTLAVVTALWQAHILLRAAVELVLLVRMVLVRNAAQAATVWRRLLAGRLLLMLAAVVVVMVRKAERKAQAVLAAVVLAALLGQAALAYLEPLILAAEAAVGRLSAVLRMVAAVRADRALL